VSRGRQFWEPCKIKAFRLTRVSVKQSSDKRGSTVFGILQIYSTSLATGLFVYVPTIRTPGQRL
jgi:hypothetical protein